MGAYLSEPVTEKVSSDEVNEKLDCGASSMQGWRVNQEDSHNTILDYDKDTSFFAVYDGHGGAEVALYCSQKLPDYIKNTEAYKSGDMTKALEDAFLGFDASIASEEVMGILKELAGEINPAGPSDNEESDEDENVSNLFQEAHLPLQEVLAKYDNKLGALHRNRLGDTATPLSPCLRAKKNEEGGSGDGPSSSKAGSSSSMGSASSSGAGDGPSTSAVNPLDEDAGVSSTNNSEVEKELNGEVTTSKANTKASTMETDVPKETLVPDSSEDNHCEAADKTNAKVKPVAVKTSDVDAKTSDKEEKNSDAEAKTELCNGDAGESKIKEGQESDISSSQNGEATPVKGGKSPASKEEVVPGKSKKNHLRRNAAAAMYKCLMMAAENEDDDDSDSNDENFEGGEGNSSDEEKVNGVDDSEDECEEEEDEEEEEEEEGSSDEEGEEDLGMTEEPGNDSGCTAVVALLKDSELFVANAGDSRCIVCREGKAVDMSIDHKPEDAPEFERITTAGGKVSNDGRINGGLNLSRAIGDHSYKQNKELDAKQQMITAYPDVKTIKLDSKDEYMVLACDGIWNFMSSQDVCDFISPRLAEGRERLSQICEEMFDHCLAPSTLGDGTGCDNMTAIIVKFKQGLITEIGSHTTETKKRAADDVTEDIQDSKRQKVEDTLSSSVVTSSV